MAAATEAEASGSGGGGGGGSADSYIGSLISLTSKFEIRYEGVLFNINTEESSIGLKNVRSFGTEGRKKDGPQIPPSDKVYEYILFRGSDIKDLQVKASPPVQPTPPIHNDPAIIQSHYSRPTSLSTSMPSVGSGTVVDPSSHTAQPGLPRPAFQGGLPVYQPGGNLVSWGSPPVHPNVNGSGLPMPMYWQGFYGPSSGLPHMQQPPLIRPPPGLPIPHSMQQQMQYPGMNVSLPSGSQNLPAEVPSLLPPVTTSSLQGLISTAPSASLPPVLAAALPYEMSSNLMPNKVSSLPPGLATALPYEMSSNLMPNKVPSLPSALGAALPYEMSSNLMPNKVPSLQPPFSTSSNQSLISTMLSPSLPPIQAAALPSDMSSNLMPNKVPVNSLPMTTSSANMSLVSPLTSSLDASAAVPLISSKHMAVPASTLPYQPTLQSVSVIGGPSSSSLAETSVPLVTPDQLMQPGPTTVSLVQPLRAGKDVKVTQPASTEPSQSVPAPTRSEVQPPILPLPTLADQKMAFSPQMNGAAFQARHSNRGRERGRGNRISHSTTKFTEDFDFIAMNEKFKKDEVWGHLGRSNYAQLRANKEVASDGDADDTLETDDVETKKPVYVKDDFFDSLSCNALDRASRNGRTKFSEQMKIDTETFGDFPRHHGWGGRGPGRGGHSRGAYYGRGYGYGGRGRGPNMSSHTNY